MLYNIDSANVEKIMAENKEVSDIIHTLEDNHKFIVSKISHEIRNPLTLVYSTLQLMQMQHPEVKDFKHWYQLIDDVEFIIDLLNELSTYNNAERLTKTEFSFAKFMKHVALSFAISIENSNIEFTSYVDPTLPAFCGDKIKLKEVILNLLRNAKEAIGDSGKIDLTSRLENHQIIITIRDNGCGIDSEIISTIFDVFTTYKQGGSGLGLSISKQIIESHKGHITVESKLHKGTLFTITLPII
ncbi:sensor histidine kinase [Lachnospiraceae bacterium LCP25S3_G4]